MIPAAVRIFVCTEPMDMRQGFDRLAQVVRAKLGEDPENGSLFVFSNRGGERSTFYIRIQQDQDRVSLASALREARSDSAAGPS
jgi:transposase